MDVKLVVAFFAIASCITFTSTANGLDDVGDNDLLERIKSNDFLIVLFSELNDS